LSRISGASVTSDIALLLFGQSKLGDLGKSLGEAIRV
jgi:Sec-independent protein translocase protein TatA